VRTIPERVPHGFYIVRAAAMKERELVHGRNASCSFGSGL
jgi:hypothetical protein